MAPFTAIPKDLNYCETGLNIATPEGGPLWLGQDYPYILVISIEHLATLGKIRHTKG